jgi:PAS domain-containing protein
LRNEGFGGFILSISLFAAGVTMIALYRHDEAALEKAVQTEIVDIVGTPQEPSDSAKELGLMASALSRVNALAPDQIPRNWKCPDGEPACKALDLLPELMTTELDKALNGPEKSVDWTQRKYQFSLVKNEASDAVWPEFSEGSICQDPELDGMTSVMIPTQMKNSEEPHFRARIVRAATLSKYLDAALRQLKSRFSDRFPEHFVQAYFISPDSLLRIWSNGQPEICAQKEFSATRLWAAKSYFVHFMDKPRDDRYPTLGYIDYGGNGLVRTRCRTLELPKPENTNFQRGEFLGVLCMDIKLAVDQEAIRRRHLFFETALVSMALPGTEDFNRLSVKTQDETIETPDRSFPQTAVQHADADATTVPNAAAPPLLRRPQVDRAIDMQPRTLREDEVRSEILRQVKGMDPNSIKRDVTRLAFRKGEAFLLPLGFSDGKVEALFFYPRNPRLPSHDIWFAVLGTLCAGAAITSALYGWRAKPETVELGKQIALFRNLQVGIIRANKDEKIEECNDRAEELFQRKLPKPGVKIPPLFFEQMIECRCTEVKPAPGNHCRQFEHIYKERVSRMRASGESSAYYIRSKGEKPRWLRASATPIMKAHGGDPAEIELVGTFATITEVSPELADELQKWFEIHPRTNGETAK